MLENLLVRNIALIDELEVPFDSGLNALTGETGAGKSIVVDSITLLLGGRASKELIRSGAEKAYVEGRFGLKDCPAAKCFLEKNELLTDGDAVILSRELTAAGRSTCRIDGVAVSLGMYKQLTALFMDIHGQHEHQSLMDEKQHLSLLDAFGDERNDRLSAEVKQCWRYYQDAKRELNRLLKTLADNRDRIDILEFQKQELEKARLVRDEEVGLEQEKNLFKNAGKIESHLRTAYESLYDGGARASALDELRSAMSALDHLAVYGNDFSSLSERLKNIYYEAEDIGITVRDRLDALQYDEKRVDQVMSRLDLLHRLARKYGPTTADMLDKLSEIKQTLEQLSHSEDRTEELRTEVKKRRQAYMERAEALSESRRQIAARFERQMESQLEQLNMKGTRFRVDFAPSEESETGIDDVRFLIAPNRGESFQALAQTASGGELSRIMLAIKSISAERSPIPSMVFDEIDTGISGRTAQVVAEKMADIAKYRQVLCVTHLPQIAAMADHQYLIEKSFDGERTLTQLQLLDQDGRISELQRMLGGAQAESESAKVHAAELLRQADGYKQGI